MSDHQRGIHWLHSLGWEDLARAFGAPIFGPPQIWTRLGAEQFPIAHWELWAYPGLLVTLLALYSVRGGLRFYHLGVVVALWAMLGNSSAFHLSRWLNAVPPFESAWLVFRWRVMVLAALALAAGRGVELWLDACARRGGR